VPSKMPAEWSIVIFLDDAVSEDARLEDAQPASVCFTLLASMEQAAANEERASGGTSGLWCHWLPGLIDHATHGSSNAIEDWCEELAC
jgi:hypothetical protein